jgi:hypothetical protein
VADSNVDDKMLKIHIRRRQREELSLVQRGFERQFGERREVCAARLQLAEQALFLIAHQPAIPRLPPVG